MIALDVPPKLILPDHYQGGRPAVIRPGVDLASYFPVEIDRKTRRAIVADLVGLGAADDRRKAAKLVEAAIPFGVFASPQSLIEAYNYLDSRLTGTDSTVYNNTGVNFGTANADRWIVLHLFINGSGSTDIQANSVTMGGVGAVRIARVFFNPSAANDYEVWVAKVPTGTTGNVDVSLSRTFSAIAWALANVTKRTQPICPFSDGVYDSGSGSTISDVTSYPSGKSVIGAYSNIVGNTGTVTWTSITERSDLQLGSNGRVSYADSGLRTDAAAGTLSITCNTPSASKYLFWSTIA